MTYIPPPTPPKTVDPFAGYDDIYNRLQAQLPKWFGNQIFTELPEFGGSFGSLFDVVMWSFIISAFGNNEQFRYDWRQLRIGQYEINVQPVGPYREPTYPIANSDNLDLIANDFFGSNLTRNPNESDDNFRNRILANVMKPKATRQAMFDALVALVTPAFIQVGLAVIPPIIIEGWQYVGTYGYNDFPLAYNQNGYYGVPYTPYTCTIIVFLPHANGLANFPGYSTFGESVAWGAGYGSPAISGSSDVVYTWIDNLSNVMVSNNGDTLIFNTESVDIPPMWFGDESNLNYYITMQQILNVINLTKVEGTVVNLIIQYV